jgi:NAD(P)-dependent dehydrogenase (short-subunit alcohol dehydrogenase family)
LSPEAPRGIGGSIAHRLAEAGASVIVADVDERVGTDMAEELRTAHGTDCRFVRTDVSASAQVVAVADLVVRELGGLDVWVNNAGVYPLVPVLELEDQQWDEPMSINLRGAFIGAR